VAESLDRRRRELVADRREARKVEPEYRPLSGARDRAAAAVSLRDRVDDRQAQTDATRRACARRVRPPEPVEDALERVRRDARALVLDFDRDDLTSGSATSVRETIALHR
jgi:hypothetical protein